MKAKSSVEYAKELLSLEAIVFFEVWLQEGEDPLEVAQAIATLGCSTVVDRSRRVIKVFSANPMPKGFGFL